MPRFNRPLALPLLSTFSNTVCDPSVAPSSLFLENDMKLLSTLVLSASLFAGIAVTGCETSHTESDKPGLLGGNTHTETTTTKNPITGDTNVQQSQTKTP